MLTPQPPALITDFYQLTMAAVYHASGMNDLATFSLFSHMLPPSRGYYLAAGLEDALDFLENYRISAEEVAYLRSLGLFEEGFLEYLTGLRFTGEVWAPAEGTALFAGEPFLEVTAPLIEAQLVETHLVNLINLPTIIASKAARCMAAARGRTCVDFALRRTQGLFTGNVVARSSVLAGFASTSNVAAARELGLPPVGTMAHSYVEAFGDEVAAFEAFAEVFPGQVVLLLDTYDSVGGLENAVAVAKRLRERGVELLGVRLDSGDLVAMTKLARQILDRNGLEKARVVVSGSLDELRIAQLLAQGARVDTFGVGTKMGCAADAPFSELSYKLVAYAGRPTLKLSSGKETWAGPKQLYRVLDGQGRLREDFLAMRGEKLPGEPLLKPVMRDGRRLAAPGDWRAARDRFAADRATLSAACLALENPRPLALTPSPALRELQARTKAAALAAQAG